MIRRMVQKCRRLILTGLIGLIICAPIGAEAQNVVTFVIDGMSREATVGFGDTIHGYLKDSPVITQMPREAAGRIVDVPWNGNLRDGQSANNAIKLLETAIRNVPAGTKINIVGHSYGTVIAYKALENLGGNGPQIENFVTLASPLGLDFVSKGGRNVPAVEIPAVPKTPGELNIRPGGWINRYAKGDPVGGLIPVEGVNNKLAGSGSYLHPFRSHSAVYGDPATVREIGQGFASGNFGGTQFSWEAYVAGATAKTLNVIQEVAVSPLNLTKQLSGKAGELLKKADAANQEKSLDGLFEIVTTPAFAGKRFSIQPGVPYAVPKEGKLLGCAAGQCGVLSQSGDISEIPFDRLPSSVLNPSVATQFSGTVGNKVVNDIQGTTSTGGGAFVPGGPPVGI